MQVSNVRPPRSTAARLRIAGACLAAMTPAGAAQAAGPLETDAACREPPPRAAAWTVEQARRHREVWSDSLWLIRRVRERHGDRLAGIYVDVEQPVAARLVIRVTGDAPLPPMRLADRAKDAPVVVEYGAPYSLKQVEALRARAMSRTAALVPGLQGVAHDEAAGAILLIVHAPDAAAERRALARCGALQGLYGMPVRIEPMAGVLSLE